MYRKTVLDNGLRILTTNMPHVRSVSVVIFLGVGSRYEKDEEGGAAHFIEHMLFKGSQKRPTARDIAIAIEGVGGVFNASTGRELTVYWTKVALPHLDTALDVLTDMLLRPLFDPQELEKERRVIVEEIHMSHDIPAELSRLLLNKLLWPDHPLGREVAGTKESVMAMTRDSLLAFLHRHYQPANAVVSVAGNVEHEATVEKIASYLSDWVGSEPPSYVPFSEKQKAPSLRLEKKETEQVNLRLGVHSLPYRHPDRFALYLLNAVLGEGMSSRLFQEVRDKRGLAYAVDSYLTAFRDTGMMGVYAGVDPSKATEALEAILGELERIREEEIPPHELNRAKELVKGQLLLSLEDTFDVAAWFGRQEIMGGPVLTVDEVIAAIDAVKADDVRRLARRLFRREKMNLAVVGPFQDEERFASLLESTRN